MWKSRITENKFQTWKKWRAHLPYKNYTPADETESMYKVRSFKQSGK